MPKGFLRNITRLKAGIILFLISTIIISSSYMYIYNLVIRSNENIIPDWIPSEYKKNQITWGELFPTEQELLIVPMDREWKGKVTLDTIASVNGKWKSNWCKMEITSPENIKVETKSKTNKEWSEKAILTRSLGIVNIETKILFKKEWLHKTVTAKIGMEVEYPKFTGNNSDPEFFYYEDRTALLNRIINFYVVTKDEMKIIKKNIAPSENQTEGILFITSIIAIILGLIMLIYSIIAIVSDRVEKIMERVRRKRYEL